MIRGVWEERRKVREASRREKRRGRHRKREKTKAGAGEKRWGEVQVIERKQ